MTPAAPFTPSPGALVGGKYRLEAPLARGGMGAVWTARHVDLGTQVAVKFMDATYAASPLLRARFAREAKAAAGLRNKHIVDVRDYGLDGEVPYLVMELLTGEDLGTRLGRDKRLSLQATAALVAQIAKALKGAHELGVVHRDLKPGNIFLAASDDEEIVKVLDFGIAKDTASAFGGDTTATGEVIGSPHYMSPEQIRGAKDLDARSDVWALGVIVFRCLTGKVPFDAEVVGAIIGQILADPIPIATQVAPDLPPAVDAFFAQALSRDRAQRFATARDLSHALSLLAGLPTLTELTVASFARPDLPSTLPASAAPATPTLGDDAKTLVMAPVGSKSAGTFGAVSGERPKARPAPWVGAVIAMLSLAAIGTLVLVLRPATPNHASPSLGSPPATTAPSASGDARQTTAEPASPAPPVDAPSASASSASPSAKPAHPTSPAPPSPAKAADKKPEIKRPEKPNGDKPTPPKSKPLPNLGLE